MNKHAETIVLAVVFAVGTAGAPGVASASSSMQGVGPLHIWEGANTSLQSGIANIAHVSSIPRARAGLGQSERFFILFLSFLHARITAPPPPLNKSE